MMEGSPPLISDHGSQDADGALIFLCYPLDVVDQVGLPGLGKVVASCQLPSQWFPSTDHLSAQRYHDGVLGTTDPVNEGHH